MSELAHVKCMHNVGVSTMEALVKDYSQFKIASAAIRLIKQTIDQFDGILKSAESSEKTLTNTKTFVDSCHKSELDALREENVVLRDLVAMMKKENSPDNADTNTPT